MNSQIYPNYNFKAIKLLIDWYSFKFFLAYSGIIHFKELDKL